MSWSQLKGIIVQIVEITGRLDHKLFHEMIDRLLTDEKDVPKAHYFISNW